MMIGMSALLFACGLATVGAALVMAARSDLRSFTIENRYPAIIVAAYPAALFGLPPSVWSLGLATGALALLIGALLFARQWVGGGDVKLVSAVALWAGPLFIDDFLMVTSVAAVFLAAAIVLTPLPRLLGCGQGPVNGFSQPMPFGAPIAAGGLWVVALHFTAF